MSCEINIKVPNRSINYFVALKSHRWWRVRQEDRRPNVDRWSRLYHGQGILVVGSLDSDLQSAPVLPRQSKTVSSRNIRSVKSRYLTTPFITNSDSPRAIKSLWNFINLYLFYRLILVSGNPYVNFRCITLSSSSTDYDNINYNLLFYYWPKIRIEFNSTIVSLRNRKCNLTSHPCFRCLLLSSVKHNVKNFEPQKGKLNETTD